MPHVENKVAKMFYCRRQDGTVIAYTPKAASTFIHQHCGAMAKQGIAEARSAVASGQIVALFVRHPLDRLVSNYVFWRTKNISGIGSMIANHAKRYEEPIPRKTRTGKVVELRDDSFWRSLTIEEFFDIISKLWNEHWNPQYEMHSDKLGLVPNELWPIESLLLLQAPKVNDTEHPHWETYYSEEFRAQAEEYYKQDLELYEQAYRDWEARGKIAPPYFRR